MAQLLLNRTVLLKHVPILRKFEDAWRCGIRPSIGEHLPAEGNEHRPLLVELIHLDLVYRCQSDGSARVEEYLSRYPELADDRVVLRDLIATEYAARRPRVSISEFHQRFPELIAELEPALRSSDTQDGTRGEATADTAAEGSTQSASDQERLDRYVLLGEQGRGGFGVVWRAIDPKLGREIAVKQLRGPAVCETSRRRFINEARISARLEHPGVVPVHDMGAIDGKHPFYTMKLVSGETLAEAMQRFHASGPRPAGDRSLEQLSLLNAFLAVVKTMEYVHAQGVIHRDLKPRNIILGKYGETVILDWGLAKLLEEDDSPADTLIAQTLANAQETVQGTVQGTPAYMSPEQAAGRTDEVDGRSDIYALGVILYQLLTGRLPFEGRTSREVLRKVCEDEPSRPRLLNAAVPKALEAICLRAMAKRRAARYSDVGHLRQDLERYLADEPVSAHAESLLARFARWARHHRSAVISGGVALVVLSVVMTWALLMIAAADRRATRVAALAQTSGYLARASEAFASDDAANKIAYYLEKSIGVLGQVAEDATAEPKHRQALASQYETIGTLQWVIHHRAEGCLPAFDEALRIRQQIVASDPASVRKRHQLAWLSDRQALLSELGGLPETAEHRHTALLNWRRLADADLAAGPPSEDLWVDHWNVAEALALVGPRGDSADACLEHWQRVSSRFHSAHDLLQRWGEDHPSAEVDKYERIAIETVPKAWDSVLQLIEHTPRHEPDAKIAGSWKHNYGELRFSQDGRQVQGVSTYNTGNYGKYLAVLQGRVLLCAWFHLTGRGVAVLVFDENNEQADGVYLDTSSGETGKWRLFAHTSDPASK